MKNGKISEASGKGRDMAALSKSYLMLYNGAQTAGWSYILLQTINYIIKNKSAVGLWKICGPSVILFQTLAVLEVLHCILRLVPANPVVTLMQVASRVMQVLGIMLPIEKVQNSPALALTLIAWGITEIVRYSYYCAQLVGKPSKLHSWCRYSFFYGLYPAGVTGEVSSILLALDTIKNQKLFSISLPNAFNFSFSYYYANILVLLMYIPCFPFLFSHMMRQRKKVLAEESPKKEK